MKTYIKSIVYITCFASIGWLISSCASIEIVQTTTNDVNMYSYLKKYPDKFSDFSTVIEKAGYANFLDAYGAYTMFLPNNVAMQVYMKSLGKSVDQITAEEAKNIAKIHIIRDTLTTKSFTDGKLPLVTMYGQYLLGGVGFAGGVSSYTVNRQASIIESNIITGNGILHVIDNVLKPAMLSVSEVLEKDPNYSIFTEALKQTGYYDSLKVVSTDENSRWVTILAEPNSVLNKAGFANFDALKKRYSNSGNPKSKSDSLNLYVAYHLLPGLKYLADIISSDSHLTKIPLEVVTSTLDEQTVRINQVLFNGITEPGVELVRASSDNATTNGVIHAASGHFTVKIRKPYPLYWDVGDFPEIRKLPAYFRKQTYAFDYATIKDMTWEKNGITYAFSTCSSFPCFYNDYLVVPLGIGNAARSNWFQIKTPLLVKGKYKVWICYRSQKQSTSGSGSTITAQVSFDGNPIPRPVTFTETAPAGTEGELESLGWKVYVSPGTDRNMSARLLGVVDVKTTDRHTLYFQAINGGQNTNNLDMIHFIPIELNQVNPRFTREGLQVYP